MGKIIESLISISEATPNELSLRDDTLLTALMHLENLQDDLCQLKGAEQTSDDFQKFIKPLLDAESLSKKNIISWRVVIDMANEGGIYTEDPVIQICSGAPSYHRFIMTFGKEGVETRVDTNCVVSNPNLSVIYSKGPLNQAPLTLEQIKKSYDEAMIQRIAILGSARVFAHPEFIDPNKPELGQKEPDSKQQWAQEYNKRVEIELNGFLDIMEYNENQFVTINGGWAGVKEQSTGIPLISSLMGAISDAEHEHSLPPITIMPEVGTFDRVITRADAYQNHPVSREEGHVDSDIHTFFEVPGIWGDDSKYLVGVSTSLMVFEPYGFWTNIEIANGVAQGKPVAIIIDPANLAEGKPYFEKIQPGAPYAEIEIPLPGGTTGVYRIYKSAMEATKWMNKEAMKEMKKTAALKDTSQITKSKKEQLQNIVSSRGEELDPISNPTLK